MPKKTALVTGGARGIGFGIAKALAAENCDLAINGVREEDEVAGALAELRGLGARVVYCRGDVGLDSDRQFIVDTVKSEFGALHVLVNNAGISSPGRKDLLEAGEDAWDRVLDTNLKGPFFLTQLAARWMVEQSETDSSFSGSIINVSSVSGEMVSTNRGDYCISKAGLSMHNKLWAARLAEYSIPVYEISPGLVRSDMTAPVVEKYDRLIAGGLVPERRWGLPEDVGRAAAMLVRGDMSYATGQVLKVDGGMTIGVL